MYINLLLQVIVHNSDRYLDLLFNHTLMIKKLNTILQYIDLLVRLTLHGTSDFISEKIFN